MKKIFITSVIVFGFTAAISAQTDKNRAVVKEPELTETKSAIEPAKTAVPVNPAAVQPADKNVKDKTTAAKAKGTPVTTVKEKPAARDNKPVTIEEPVIAMPAAVDPETPVKEAKPKVKD